MEFLGEAVDATDTLLDDMRSAGTHEVDQGKAVARVFLRGIGRAREILADAQDDARTLPTGDKARFQICGRTIQRALDRGGSEVQGVFDAAESRYDIPELNRAFDRAEPCRSLSRDRPRGPGHAHARRRCGAPRCRHTAPGRKVSAGATPRPYARRSTGSPTPRRISSTRTTRSHRRRRHAPGAVDPPRRGLRRRVRPCGAALPQDDTRHRRRHQGPQAVRVVRVRRGRRDPSCRRHLPGRGPERRRVPGRRDHVRARVQHARGQARRSVREVKDQDLLAAFNDQRSCEDVVQVFG